MITQILENLIPLYILIGLGYYAGRKLDVNLHSVARINLFILLPIVTLGATARMDLNPAYALLPFVIMGVSYVIALSAYRIAGLFWSDGTENLIATAGVNCNAIYFGLPIILTLFGTEGVAVYLFMNLGGSINNVTLGYYLSARGRFSVKDSLIKVVKFPTIYAAIGGLMLNGLGVEMSEVAERYWHFASGGLVFFGMMMIGVAISKLDRLRFNWKELSAYFLVKSVAWPVLLGSFVFIDIYYLHLFDAQIHQMLIIFSAMPVMGNLVAYAAEHNLHPERAGAAVLVSSIGSLITIPAAYYALSWLGGH